eukprot:m.351798 g.351798  ORF g.351798 m.351798 type:complete len:123 (+) comp16356_c0_seq1:537-905(+)
MASPQRVTMTFTFSPIRHSVTATPSDASSRPTSPHQLTPPGSPSFTRTPSLLERRRAAKKKGLTLSPKAVRPISTTSSAASSDDACEDLRQEIWTQSLLDDLFTEAVRSDAATATAMYDPTA